MKCHSSAESNAPRPTDRGHMENSCRRLALVGTPNVGKSVLFNALTGLYVTVSNYPGTTVEVSRGRARIDYLELEVVDTPGMYSMTPITEEEAIARRLLLEEKPDLVLHVVDAKNLERCLSQTFELLESGFNIILVLNMIDEAERAGMKIDAGRLEALLGIPVVTTAATIGRGLTELKERVKDVVHTYGRPAAN